MNFIDSKLAVLYKNIPAEWHSVSLNWKLPLLLSATKTFLLRRLMFDENRWVPRRKSFKAFRNHFTSPSYYFLEERREERKNVEEKSALPFVFFFLEAEINHSTKLNRKLLFWLFEVVFKYFDMFLTPSWFFSKAETTANASKRVTHRTQPKKVELVDK